jgi:group I intron endonuclease
MTGIYKITNPNGRVYIGQSTNIEYRLNDHKSPYRYNTDEIPLLYRSFRKYGVNAHTFEVLEECKESELNIRERFYQEKYNVLNGGLNSTLTKAGDFSGNHSEESKKKMSEAKKGKPAWNKGMKWSEERKKEASLQRRGRTAPNKGKPMPKHQLEAQIGRKLSDETKHKISEANKKAWGAKSIDVVEEHNRKHSERMSGEGNPMYGKSHSKDTIKKLKQKAKGRYTLEWFIEKNGEVEGKRMYEEKKKSLSEISRKMWEKRKGLV